MKRIKHLLPDLFLVCASLLCVWLFVLRHGAFASSVDYLSQHSVFPEYFRQQFYATGQLLPQFAPNLGGGQNVFHFAYYGLLSPLILPSYLLPSVSMTDYLQAAMILCLTSSVLLLYHWLQAKGYGYTASLSAALLLLLAGPMIFHSYRHIMFVDYMPFLIMAFMGVDRYWQRRKSGLLMAGVFLMAMTSFYFSVGGLLALWLYGTSQCHRKWRFGYLLFLLSLVAGLLTAACLLLPSFLALLGRGSSGSVPSLKELLLPDLDPSSYCYNTYSLGLPTICLSVLLYDLGRQARRERLLSGALLAFLLIPLFRWLLGGMLYIREKSLIPLLPLILLRWSAFLCDLKAGKLPTRRIILALIPAAIISAACFLAHIKSADALPYLLLAAESLVTLALFPLFHRHPAAVSVVPLCFLFAFGLTVHAKTGAVIPADSYAAYSSDALQQQITDTLSSDPGWYRLEESGSYDQRKANLNRVLSPRQWITSLYSSAYDAGYSAFCKNTFQLEQPYRNILMQGASKNPLFQKLMGVKYIVDPTTGSTLVQSDAAPIAYGTETLISRADFNRLSFPYQQLALMKYAVTDSDIPSDPGKLSHIHSLAAPVSLSLPSTGAIHPDNAGYRFKSSKAVSTTLTLDGAQGQDAQLLMLQFDVINGKDTQDLSITVAGIRNKLTARSHIYYNENTTFTYVALLEPGQTEVPITLGRGTYQLQNIRCYLAPADILEDTSLYQSVFQPDFQETKGNRITGTISVSKTETFVTSIPYDSGFSILVDGRRSPTQTVNTTFLGCSLSPGRHTLVIEYHAPGYYTGLLLSALGAVLWLSIVVLEWRKKVLSQ